MKTKFPKIDGVALARYVVAKKGPLSHLKLQKLLYYIEAWHLAQFKGSLIIENFEAWVHGPVCTNVWHHFKDVSKLHGDIEITAVEKKAIIKEVKESLLTDQIELIDDVLDEYNKRTAYYLECLTHEELPWREARKDKSIDSPSTTDISKDTMMKFYSKKYEQIA
jgi:uncharacterized phage-associated protein